MPFPTTEEFVQFVQDGLTAVVTESQESFKRFVDKLWEPWFRINPFDPFSWLAALAGSIFGTFDAFATLITDLGASIPYAFFEACKKLLENQIPKSWGYEVMTRKEAFKLSLDLLCDDAPRDVVSISDKSIIIWIVVQLRTVLGKISFLRKLGGGDIITRYLDKALAGLKVHAINRLITLLYAGFRFWGLVVLFAILVAFIGRVNAKGYGTTFQQRTPRKRVRVRNREENAGKLVIRRRMVGGSTP